MSNTLSMYWREKKTPCPTVIFPHVKHTLTISKKSAHPPWLPYLTQLLAPASVISSSPPTLAVALLNLDSWTPSPLKLGTHHHNHHSDHSPSQTILPSIQHHHQWSPLSPSHPHLDMALLNLMPFSCSNYGWGGSLWRNDRTQLGKASKTKSIFLGKSPKLWVGGGQES